jgi:sugar phosphate isomerase/epimerase
MKTALHSVSYAGLWGQAFLPLEDFLSHARQLGFSAVMLMAKRPHLSVLDCDDAQRKKLREHLRRLDLKIACLAGYTDFTLGAERPDIPNREMQLLYVRELCRLARDLDCPFVRVFTGYHHPSLTVEQNWNTCIASLKEAARIAATLDVTLGVQNHHDTGVHFESIFDLLQEVGDPHCQAMFDAWAPALQGCDLTAAVKKMAPYIVHTTVADYVRRPRYRYEPQLVNYVPETDAIRAVPMGDGFIDYRKFFQALQETKYQGYVAYEMCSPLRGGGSQGNLDLCARRFLDFMGSL